MVETRGNRRFALIFLAAAFIVLLAGRFLKPVDDVALTIAAPFESALSGIAGGIGDLVTGITQGPQLRAQNQTLRKELGLALHQNILLQQDARENALLRRMVRFSDLNDRLDLVPARVIGTDPNAVTPYVIVNRGSRDGLRLGMTVLDQNGYYVGQISSLVSDACKVLLMVNPSSTVGAVDMNTRAAGDVEGVYAGSPQLRYVPTKAKLQVGDFVVTSGQLNLFPRNILLGQIVAVHHSNVRLTQSAELQPAADFQNLDLVQIVRGFVPNEPVKLLNP